jgi:RNA polymerase sigma factor (sigma-70 family)
MNESDRVRRYEGLARRMASSVVGLVPDLDFDDLCQQYRVVTWKALRSYDRAHIAGLTEYRYVVMCMKNREFDLRKRVRHPVDSIDEIMSRPQSRDDAEARLLSSSAEAEFAEVEDPGLDLGELGAVEAEIVVRLYVGWSQADVARELGLEKNAMTRAMRKIRRKLEDRVPGVLEAPAVDLVLRAA